MTVFGLPGFRVWHLGLSCLGLVGFGDIGMPTCSYTGFIGCYMDKILSVVSKVYKVAICGELFEFCSGFLKGFCRGFGFRVEERNIL